MFGKPKSGITISTIAAVITVVLGVFTIDSRYANADSTKKSLKELLESTNTAVKESREDTRAILLDFRIEYYSDQIDLMLIRQAERDLIPIEERRLDQMTNSLERLVEEKDRLRLLEQ